MDWLLKSADENIVEKISKGGKIYFYWFILIVMRTLLKFELYKGGKKKKQMIFEDKIFVETE